MANNRSWLKTLGITLLVFLYQQFASKAGTWVAQLLSGSRIDPDNIFFSISIHHLVQLLLALVAICLCMRFTSFKFYLRPKNVRRGFQYLGIFALAILIYTFVSYLLGYLNNTIAPVSYPLNVRNVLGTLGFQLLLSGPSEELLFRALPIALLKRRDTNIKYNKRVFSMPVMIAALLFSLAHINWSLFPFSIAADGFQLVYAFVLGVVYGIAYERTQCVIYPMAMHSISNFFMVGMGYLFQLI